MRSPVLSSRTRNHTGEPTAEATPRAEGAAAAPDRRLLWLLLALSVLPILVATVAAARQPWLPVSDIAVIELQSLDVFGDAPLTGAYSRYGFDHPGPFEFYVLALPVQLFGPSGMLWGSGLIAATSVAVVVWVAWRRGATMLAALTSMTTIILAAAMGDELVSPWNPLVPILPFMALVLLTWSVTCEDWWALPGVVVASAFAAQAHLAFLPFAIGFGALSLGWMVVTWFRRVKAPDGKRPRPTLLPLGVACLVGAFLWSGPMVDQIAGDGNLGAIVEHSTTDREAEGGVFGGGQTAGLDRALGVVAREVSVPGPLTGEEIPVDVFTGQVEGGPLWRLLPLAALLAAGSLVAFRRREFDALKLNGIVLALSLASVVVVSRIDGGVFTYLVQWLWVVGALIVLSGLWSLVAGSRLVRPPLERIAVVVVACTSLLVAFSLRTAQPPQPGMSDALRSVIGPTEDAVDRIDPDGTVLVESTGSSFGTVLLHGGMIAELERRGVDVRVPNDEQQRSIYPTRTLGEGEVVAAKVVLAPVVGTETFADRPGARIVAVHDTLTPEEWDELAALETAVAEIGKTSIVNVDFARFNELRDRAAESVAVVVVPEG